MKILKITVNNFKQCEKNFTISFVPEANKTLEDKEFELHEIADSLFVFTTLGIVGKNASGKTTAINLISLVYDIFSNFRVKTMNHLMNNTSNKVNLDITFYHDGFLYRYVTDLLKNEQSVDNIIIFDNQKLYKREYYKAYASDLFNYDKFNLVSNISKLPEDTSILYEVLGNIEMRGMYYSVEDDRNINFASTFNIYKMLENNHKILQSIIKIFDEHLDNIEMIDDNKYKIKYTNQEVLELSNKELYNILSSGTTKGIALFTSVVYSLKNGTDLIIDEIENHFHKTLVENIINLYKDKAVNKKNATLIFSTHYCELLDLFNRTDNIYITKYDQKIKLENVHKNYKFRPELSKSKKFYNNAFNTNVNYESLINLKKELI